MFGNNSDDDDSSTARNARRFIANTFGIGDAPEEEGAEIEVEDEEMATVPSAIASDFTPQSVNRWTLGDHTSADEGTEDNIQAALDSVDSDLDDDLRGVLEDAASMVSTASVSGFECPTCGLKHGHSDSKHDIRTAFNVTEDFTNESDWTPYCHCGVNWLAEMVDFVGYSEIDIFTDSEQFEPFLSAGDPSAQEQAVSRLQKMRSDPDVTVSIEEALEEAGLAVTDEMVIALDDFYTRYVNIKNAAEGAPIASETRTTISEMREMVDEAITQAVSEPDGDLGTITFFNTVGGYGFVSSDAYDEDVFFNTDDLDGVVDADIEEGREVVVEATHEDKGYRATSMTFTDE